MGSTRRKLLGIIPAAVVVSLVEQFPALAVACGDTCYKACADTYANYTFFQCGGGGRGKCCRRAAADPAGPGRCRDAKKTACPAAAG